MCCFLLNFHSTAFFTRQLLKKQNISRLFFPTCLYIAGMKTSFLLVDDDADDALLFEEALSELGIECDFYHATNGIQAIDLLDKMNPQKPDYIFLDMKMPVMGGGEFFEKVKNRTKPRSVFILTGQDNERIKVLLMSKGIAGFFTKPSSFSELKKLIRTAIPKEPDLSRC